MRSLLAVTVLVGIAGCNTYTPPTYPLSALQATKSVHGELSGSIFWIRGTLNGVASYQFMCRIRDGGNWLICVPSSSCFIYEDATADTAYVEVSQWCGHINHISMGTFRLHVPPDTIATYGFSVDMKDIR